MSRKTYRERESRVHLDSRVAFLKRWPFSFERRITELRVPLVIAPCLSYVTSPYSIDMAMRGDSGSRDGSARRISRRCVRRSGGLTGTGRQVLGRYLKTIRAKIDLAVEGSVRTKFQQFAGHIV